MTIDLIVDLIYPTVNVGKTKLFPYQNILECDKHYVSL